MKKLIAVIILLTTQLFAGEYPVHVISVHDGDTFKGKISLGLDVYIEANIRLYGINAPELSTGKPGKVSTDRLTALINGKDIILVTNPSKEHEKYGRVLGTVMIGTTNINKQMVQEGLAIPFMEDK